MPRLVHLNGPPGIGKSTLACRYVGEHPLAFCLDIDKIRSLIGGWREHPQASGQLARAMAVVMARQHLTRGHDVVVPQLVARPGFVEELREVAVAAGAGFYEIVLLDAADAAQARFEARAVDPAWREHHLEAVRMLNDSGGFATMFAALDAALPKLPALHRVMTHAGDIAGAYASVMRILEGEPRDCPAPELSDPAPGAS